MALFPVKLLVSCLISAVCFTNGGFVSTTATTGDNTLPRDTNGTVNTHDLLARDDGVPSSYSEGTLRGSVVLYNGKIHTMDASDTVANVIGIKDGKIVYVGNSQTEALHRANSLSSSPQQQPRAINLRGRITIPGLIDCHNHIVLLGNRPGYHTPLESAASIADVQATYKARASAVPKGSFITTIGGFSPNQFAERRLPTLAELDAAAPDHPVFISTSFAGPATTNTLGKNFFQSLPGDMSVAVSANGSIAIGLENGKALLSLRQQLTFADRKRTVHDTMAYAASLGLTTHLDQGAFAATNTPADIAASEDLYTFHLPWLSVYDDLRGIIRLRINFLSQDTDLAVPAVTQRLLNTFKFFGNDMVRTGAIGEFVTADYDGGPVFDQALRAVAKAGWRLEVHSLTDTDYQRQIRAFEAVNSAFNITSLRWVVAHVPQITQEYLARLKRLGGGVNLSGWQYLAGTGNTTNPAGPPWRRIIDSGIPAGFGADGANIAPLSPWPHIYYATTGKNSKGELINPGQTISRLEALKLYTTANNWFLGGPDEGTLGVLEEGRLGDVVVLSDDYFSVSEEKLKKMKSVLTVVGGVVVYDSGDL
ncbi:amidohydrolase family-domain-containing protein [Apodospora peruviana]|uniref:Amidohydrolase family-domain-containing protein n=1 Tax=Apodospora peruviana TaxID=516989 RepID=A0AAE0MBP1_9PEZI|nr:amidohydrolase family-domain-containing protein [Apodospora peruviana]